MADIQDNFEKQDADETEKIILKNDKRIYVEPKGKEAKHLNLKDLVKMVARDYEDRKVSVSLLNNFFECPWKWYFRNLLQLPEPKSESLEFGNIVHGSISAILKSGKKPNEKDLGNIISYQIQKSQFGDEKKKKELASLALNIVSRWAKNRLGEISQDRESEQSVSINNEHFPHLNIYGKIDLIERLDKANVRVTDFKTGSIRRKSEIEKFDEEGRMSTYLRQLTMYSYLIKQSPKWKAEVRESRLEFVEAKKESEVFYNTVIDNEHVNMIIKDINDYDTLVKNGRWINRSCHYNSYGKGIECEYCKMAEIYNQN